MPVDIFQRGENAGINMIALPEDELDGEGGNEERLLSLKPGLSVVDLICLSKWFPRRAGASLAGWEQLPTRLTEPRAAPAPLLVPSLQLDCRPSGQGSVPGTFVSREVAGLNCSFYSVR